MSEKVWKRMWEKKSEYFVDDEPNLIYRAIAKAQHVWMNGFCPAENSMLGQRFLADLHHNTTFLLILLKKYNNWKIISWFYPAVLTYEFLYPI